MTVMHNYLVNRLDAIVIIQLCSHFLREKVVRQLFSALVVVMILKCHIMFMAEHCNVHFS